MPAYPGFMPSFAELIAAPSISSVDPNYDQSNRTVIDLLANWLEDLGGKVERMPIHGVKDKYNLVACFGEGEGGLVLSGHTDTVPYDAKRWETDPFTLTEKDHKLYGLGATDMKVFFPLVMDVLANLDLKKLQQPIFVLATADEESTMSGANQLLAAGHPLGRHALIGEPTGLQPIHQHKGVMMEGIRVVGQAGHSSNPNLGNNAIDAMHGVLAALYDLREGFKQQYQSPGFTIPYPTMNIGSIHGGDNPNRICGHCDLKLDVRLVPGMDIEQTRARIRETAFAAVEGLGVEVQFDDLFSGLPAMYTDKDAEIIQLAEHLADRPAGSVGFATEGPYLNALGMHTVVIGPGDIDVAHQADEYVPRARLDPMKNIINGMIQTLCY